MKNNMYYLVVCAFMLLPSAFIKTEEPTWEDIINTIAHNKLFERQTKKLISIVNKKCNVGEVILKNSMAEIAEIEECVNKEVMNYMQHKIEKYGGSPNHQHIIKNILFPTTIMHHYFSEKIRFVQEKLHEELKSMN